MPLPSLDACSYLNVCSATLDGANCTYPIELRWRTTPWDLRALWRLHELSFPISYPASYYHSLLNARDTAVMLISTTAAACAAAPRTGSSSIFSCKPPRDVKQKEQRRQAWPPHRTLWAKEVVDEWEEVAELISLMEDEAWSRSPSASTAVGELANQSDGTSQQQQQQQQPTTSSSATEMGSSAATRGKDGACEGDRDDDDVGNPDYMILVGFAIGGLAYGGRGNFFINPTGYLGSIAVEPWLRGSGLGDVLLSHFTHYLSTSFPVYAEDYLHYDAQRDYMAVINYRKRQACLAMKEMLNPPSTSTAKKVNGGGDGGGVGEVHVDDGDDEDAAAAATTSTNNNNNNNVPEYISDAELNKFLAELCDDEVEEIMAPRYLAGAVLGSCFPPRLPTWSYEQHRQRLKQRKESLKEALANPHHREARWLRHLASPAAMAELNPLLHRGVRTVWLHCLANQTGLVQFYNRHNFIRVRTLPNFYEFTDGSRHAATLMMFDADVESTLDRACYPGVEEDYDAALARCALDSLPVEVQGGGGDVMVRESDVAANDPANRLRLWREVDNTRHLNYMIRRQQWLNKTGDSWKATTSQPDFDGWMNEFPYWLSPAMYEVVQYLDPRQQNKSKEAWTSVCKTGWKPTDTPLGISPLVMWVYLGINALLIGGAFLLSFFARSETEEA